MGIRIKLNIMMKDIMFNKINTTIHSNGMIQSKESFGGRSS